MLLALIALLAGAIAGWLAGRPGGRTQEWPAATWRAPVLVPAGAALALTGGRWVDGGAGLAVLAAGYAALTAFAVVNARRQGFVLIAVGLLANLVVLVADGGMPVRSEPPGAQIGSHHHGLSTRDHLAGLADTVSVSPLDEMVSPGDLVAAAGGATAIFFWLQPSAGRRPSRSRRRRRGAGRSSTAVSGLVRPW